MRIDICFIEVALFLFSPQVTQCQQAGKSRISGLVGWIGQQARAVQQVKADGRNKFNAPVFGDHIGAHHTGKGIAVSNRNGAVTQIGGGVDQFFRMAAAQPEAEITGDL